MLIHKNAEEKQKKINHVLIKNEEKEELKKKKYLDKTLLLE
jgi:hypothetical protein